MLDWVVIFPIIGIITGVLGLLLSIAMSLVLLGHM